MSTCGLLRGTTRAVTIKFPVLAHHINVLLLVGITRQSIINGKFTPRKFTIISCIDGLLNVTRLCRVTYVEHYVLLQWIPEQMRSKHLRTQIRTMFVRSSFLLELDEVHGLYFNLSERILY